MNIINWIINIALFGVIFYLVDRFIPMDGIFQTLLRIVAVVVVIYLILALVGVVPMPLKVV
jgi:Na+/H+-dicarboxylate symporter